MRCDEDVIADHYSLAHALMCDVSFFPKSSKHKTNNVASKFLCLEYHTTDDYPARNIS